jgi:hypothetical protein
MKPISLMKNGKINTLLISGKGLNSLCATLENISKEFPVSKGSVHNLTAQPSMSTVPSPSAENVSTSFVKRPIHSQLY